MRRSQKISGRLRALGVCGPGNEVGFYFGFKRSHDTGGCVDLGWNGRARVDRENAWKILQYR